MFGDRLKLLRKNSGYTQKELGEKLNVSGRVIGYYESNERFPDKDTLTDIADFFNVSVDYLLGRTDEKNPKKEIKNATTIAAHRLGDIEQLPDDAIDEINNYIDLMRLKYLKDKK